MVYGSQDVKCPFYKDETKNTIRCEGIFSAALSNNFDSAQSKKEHVKKYCCKHFKECSLYKVVNQKYS